MMSSNESSWTEHEDRCVAVVEKHTLDGANAITLMEHKHRYMTSVEVTTMDGVITVVIAYCCDDFQQERWCNIWGSGRLRKTGRSNEAVLGNLLAEVQKISDRKLTNAEKNKQRWKRVKKRSPTKVSLCFFLDQRGTKDFYKVSFAVQKDYRWYQLFSLRFGQVKGRRCVRSRNDFYYGRLY